MELGWRPSLRPEAHPTTLCEMESVCERYVCERYAVQLHFDLIYPDTYTWPLSPIETDKRLIGKVDCISVN